MNYCTRCQSYYEQPGTCNCYTSNRIPLPPLPAPQPYIPPPVIPWQPVWPRRLPEIRDPMPWELPFITCHVDIRDNRDGGTFARATEWDPPGL